MPAASDPQADGGVPRLPLRLRPLGVRVAAVAFYLLLLGTLTVVWVALPANVQHGFSALQWGTIVAMMLAALVVAHVLARCRVDADDEGLTVVNGYRTHRYAWGQVVAVTMRSGNPWAVLDLSDGTSQAAMGIQGSDGARAKAQVRRLRALVDARAGTEPGPRGGRAPDDPGPDDPDLR